VKNYFKFDAVAFTGDYMEFDSLFRPKSVAVIGASARKGSVGYIYLDSIISGGYKGRIYPVNPRYESIQGLECYQSIGEVGAVDLAVIATNKIAALKLLEECAATGVKAAIIPTGGFEEIGEEGARLEAQIRDLAAQSGIALLGTNTLGLINSDIDLQITFNPRPLPPKGPVSIISQSGGMGLSVISKLREEGVGMSKWIGVGNRTLLDFPEFLEYLAKDSNTQAVGVFMEGTERAGEFCRMALNIVKEKPIVVYKMGQSESVDYLAVTHTGTGVGERGSYEGAFRQCGILTANSVREMVAMLKSLVTVPPIMDRDLGIFTYTAGPSIAAADLIGDHFNLRQPSEHVRRRIIECMKGEPPTVLKNPLDVDGEGYTAGQYGRLLEAFSEEYDLLATISTSDLLFPKDELIRVARNGKKIVHCHICDVSELSTDDMEELRREGIPLYTTAEELATGLIALSRHLEIRQRLAVRSTPREPVVVDASRFEHEILDEYESKRILEEAGIPVVKERPVREWEEVKDAAERIGFPLVLKVLSREIYHKSDVGGVRTGITTMGMLREVWESMRARWPDENFLVQAMVPGGIEIIVGRKKDPAFGDLISAGIGGFLADLFSPAVAMCPCSYDDCLDLVDRIEPRRLLQGYRGMEPVDREALASFLERVSRLRLKDEEILEMDLNPVMVRGNQFTVVDALIRKG